VQVARPLLERLGDPAVDVSRSVSISVGIVAAAAAAGSPHEDVQELRVLRQSLQHTRHQVTSKLLRGDGKARPALFLSKSKHGASSRILSAFEKSGRHRPSDVFVTLGPLLLACSLLKTSLGGSL